MITAFYDVSRQLCIFEGILRPQQWLLFGTFSNYIQDIQGKTCRYLLRGARLFFPALFKVIHYFFVKLHTRLLLILNICIFVCVGINYCRTTHLSLLSRVCAKINDYM